MDPVQLKSLLEPYDHIRIIGLKDRGNILPLNGVYQLVQGEFKWRIPISEYQQQQQEQPRLSLPAITDMNISDQSRVVPDHSTINIKSPTIIGGARDMEQVASGHLWTHIYRSSLYLPSHPQPIKLILKISDLTSFPDGHSDEFTEEDLEQGPLSRQLALKRISNEHHAYTAYLSDFQLQGSIAPHHFGTFVSSFTDNLMSAHGDHYAWPQCSAIAMLLEDVGSCIGTDKKSDDEHQVAYWKLPLKERIGVFTLYRELGSYGVVHDQKRDEMHAHHVRIPAKGGILHRLLPHQQSKHSSRPYVIIDFSESRYYPEGEEERQAALKSQKAWVGIRFRIHEDKNGVPVDCQNLRTFKG